MLKTHFVVCFSLIPCNKLVREVIFIFSDEKNGSSERLRDPSKGLTASNVHNQDSNPGRLPAQ